MADEKSLVKMNKMIHKKTGTSFLVVYVIYVSLVYTDSKENCVMFTPPTYLLCNFWKAIKMPTCTHYVWHRGLGSNTNHLKDIHWRNITSLVPALKSVSARDSVVNYTMKVLMQNCVRIS